MRLVNKVAVITGSGRGIGAGIARALGKEGAKVVVNDILEEQAKAVAEDIRQSGTEAITSNHDISKSAEAEALIQLAVDSFAAIDILVNNAGILIQGPVLDTTEEDVDRLFAVNFRGVWACSKAALPHMLKQGFGRIINVASNAGRRGNPNEVLYSATKGAVISLTKGLAAEFGAYNITVNAISPKAWTEMEKMNNPVKPDTYDAPVPRIGDPDNDIAPAVIFLATEEASYVTAQLLGLDGGVYR